MITNQSKYKPIWLNFSCIIQLKSICFNLLFLLLIISTLNTHGQNAIVSGGKKAATATHTLTYSVGELSVSTISNNEKTLTQGQQQGTLIITALDDMEDSGISLNAYPNPTSNFVMLSIDGNDIRELEFSLRTMDGRVLQTKTDLVHQQKIDMLEYASGIYFLSVINRQNNSVHTFKIVKQ